MTAACQASPSFSISLSLLKLMPIELEMLSNHLIFCHPIFLLPIFLSIAVSFNESALCIRWPKYWSFKLQHHSFQWILTIDFFQDWLVWFPCYPRDFQESSPASILRCSAFFMVQLSHPYMTTGKTTVLTIWTFVSKVMSFLFNMLSRFVIAFLLRSKCLLIPWLQSPSAVILEPQKI